MNIYFSEEFTNLQTNIKLEFSKKITKNEKIFLKLLFFRIISDSLFLKKAEIRFEEILSTLEFEHFLKLYQKNTYFFLQMLNFQVLLELFHPLFCILTIARYFLLKNLKVVFLSKKIFSLFLILKNLFL